MKRWTLMVVPRDRGKTRTIRINIAQMAVVACLLAGLVIIAALLFSHNRTVVREVDRVREDNRDLELRYYNQVEIERRIREEYEQSVAAIKAELDQLYRNEITRTGLVGDVQATPSSSNRGFWNFELFDGKGGSDDPEDAVCETSESLLRALGSMFHAGQYLIGHATPAPSGCETDSFQQLVNGVLARADTIARLPTGMPVSSRIWVLTSPFGIRRDPFTGRLRRHRGADIAGPKGVAVLAAGRGSVTESYYHRSRGWTVEIDHGNGIQTVYSHLNRYFVAAGDRVEGGDVIGELGNSGRSTGPHLHYEVRLFGKPVDPARFTDVF